MALYVGGTSLLLHGNGADGSTVFTDETGKTVTAYGNAHISTAQSKFGGASMYFDGVVPSRVEIPTSADFDFGVGDFTIEAFVQPSVLVGTSVMISRQEASNGMAWQMQQANAGISWVARSQGGGTVYFSAPGGTLTVDAMHHVAVTRAGSFSRAYIDGAMVGSIYDPTNLNCTRPVSVGLLNDTSLTAPFAGYIDDLRITKGIALYTADFTPPTAPLALVNPIQIGIQPHTVGNFPAGSYNPVQGKPTERLFDTALVDAAPYGMPNSLTPGYASLFEFKGRGQITGTVAEKNLPANTPLRRRVLLHRLPEGAFVAATWSDATTGAYTFSGIRPDQKYTVTSYDHTGAYRAVIADGVLPDPLP